MSFGASMGIRMGSAVVRLGVHTGASGRRVDALGRKVTTLRQRLTLLRRGFGDVRMGFASVAQGMRPAVFSGIAASALGVREALKFDQEIANLTSVTGELGAQAPAIKRGIKALALDPKNAATAIEAAEAYTMMARSGVDASKRLGAAGTALKLASLDTKLSSQDAAIFLTKTSRQFNMAFDDVGNRLARAADAIPGNVSDITTAMQYAGPAALQMGLEMDQALAMVMGAVTRMRASRAGTAIGQFLTALAKPKKVEVLNETLKEFGKQAVYVGGKMRNFGGILKDINEMFGSLDDEARGSKMYEIFGIRATRAVTMFMKAAETAGQSYDEMLAKAKSGISLMDKTRQRAKGMMAQLKHIRSSLGVIAIDFFGALFKSGSMANLSTTISQVAEAFGMLIDNVSHADRKQKKFSAGVWAAAEGIKDAVAGVQNAFTWLGEKIKWVAGLFGLEGTQEVTKFIITFVAISPVIMTVGMALMMFMSVARGVGLILLGTGRAGWALVGMWRAMSVWIMGLPGPLAMLGIAYRAIGTAWRWLGLQASLMRNKVASLTAAMIIQPGIMAKLGMTATIAGTGLKAFARGLAAALGPLGLVWVATEALMMLFDSFTDEVDDTKEALARPTAISVAPTRAGTAAEMAGRMAGYSGGVPAMKMPTQGLQKYYQGKQGVYGAVGRREALFKDLWNMSKAISGADFTADKLKALGLTTMQVEKLTAGRGEVMGQTLDQVGKSLSWAIKTHEALYAAMEKNNLERTEETMAEYAAASMANTQATAEFNARIKESGDTLLKVFEEMEIAASQKTTALAGGVDAAADANAAAANKNMKKCLQNNINLSVGGRQLAEVVSTAQLDINERGGASVHPYQRHQVVQDGRQPASSTV